MAVFKQAQLVDQADGSVMLTWQLREPATVSVYQSAFDGGEEHLVADTGATQLIVQPGRYQRHVFRLQCRQYSVTLHQQRLWLQGAPNFRDFGGYASEFGGYVRRGGLFRSGRLAHLSDDDMAFLHRLGIAHVFDLRQLKEVEHDPTTLPLASPINVNNIPIAPGNNIGLMQQLKQQAFTAERSEKAMLSVFEDFALNHGASFSKILIQLTQSPEPVLVHCSAGKDRTGATAALVLRLLGVSRDDIVQDYLRTADYYPSSPEEYDHVQSSLGALANKPEDIEPLMTVKPQFIERFFETIDTHFKSEADYFQTVYGIGEAERARLLAHWLTR